MTALSVDKMKQVVDKALKDASYAERIFKEPDAVARERGLSDDEKLVLRQMNREQFDKARHDAEKNANRAKSGELSNKELEGVAGGAGLAVQVQVTATDMIVGRSILGATGASYATLTNAACDCCAWKPTIVSSGPSVMSQKF
jgi:hypothetical protein